MRVCGFAGLRVCGFAGLRVCGFAGLRVCGFAGLRVCGFAGLRVCGFAGLRVCGFAGLRVYGFAGLRVCGFAGLRKLREGCRDDTTWADETMIMGLCEVLEMTIILVSPGAVPKIYVPRLCAPHGALGLVFTGVIAGHFETLSLNVDAVKILCAAKPLRADTCLWEPTTGPFICRGCDGHSEGAEAESHFCTTCCTSCCVACRVSQDQVTCAGPPVPMDDQPDGPRGTRRGNEDPIDNGAPHVRDLMRFHETERGLLRLWWCVRAGVHEGALKDQWEREEELEVAEMVKRHEAEMRQAGVKEEEMDVDQTQTGATPVRHPAHPDETPPMPPSSQGDWEQAGATMQDLHQTDASPQPVTPPRFAEEPGIGNRASRVGLRVKSHQRRGKSYAGGRQSGGGCRRNARGRNGRLRRSSCAGPDPRVHLASFLLRSNRRSSDVRRCRRRRWVSAAPLERSLDRRRRVS